MRVAPAWVLMTASFGATMALALWLDPFGLGGLPALPLLSLGFLLANGDLLLRSAREARRDEGESDENGDGEPRDASEGETRAEGEDAPRAEIEAHGGSCKGSSPKERRGR
jgi:hypothetical protein